MVNPTADGAIRPSSIPLRASVPPPVRYARGLPGRERSSPLARRTRAETACASLRDRGCGMFTADPADRELRSPLAALPPSAPFRPFEMAPTAPLSSSQRIACPNQFHRARRRAAPPTRSANAPVALRLPVGHQPLVRSALSPPNANRARKPSRCSFCPPRTRCAGQHRRCGGTALAAAPSHVVSAVTSVLSVTPAALLPRTIRRYAKRALFRASSRHSVGPEHSLRCAPSRYISRDCAPAAGLPSEPVFSPRARNNSSGSARPTKVISVALSRRP